LAFHSLTCHGTEDCPHVYFVGNQEKYETRLAKGSNGQVVRLIAVPAFDKTRTIVLVNLDTLNCHPITFTTWDDQGKPSKPFAEGDSANKMDVD